MKQTMLWCGLLGLAIAGCSLDLGGGKPKSDTSAGDDGSGGEGSESDEPDESDDGSTESTGYAEDSSGFVEDSGESGSELDPVWDCWCAADCDGATAEWADFVCAVDVDAVDEAIALAVDTCAVELDPQCEEFLCECECELVPDEICGD